MFLALHDRRRRADLRPRARGARPAHPAHRRASRDERDASDQPDGRSATPTSAARRACRTTSRRSRSIRRPADALTAEQERFYLASQWRLMLWKLTRHRVAVAVGHRPAADVRLDARLRDPRAVPPAHAPHRLHLRVAAGRALVPRGTLRRSVHLRRSPRRSTWRRCRREYSEDTSRVYPVRFFCSGDPLSTSGDSSTRRSTSCARPKGARCSSPAPTGWAATSSRASSTGRGSRSPSGSWASLCRFALGLLFGGIAGYFGGWVDNDDPARDRGDPHVSRSCRCGWRCRPCCR